MKLKFGALSPPISEQTEEQGVVIRNLDRLQSLADAITRLHVNGLLTEAEADKARSRLFKEVEKNKV